MTGLGKLFSDKIGRNDSGETRMFLAWKHRIVIKNKTKTKKLKNTLCSESLKLVLLLFILLM